MNLKDLRYLIAIADHQHFGKAADVCCVSQPTLSAQLKKLEDELGVQLFERTNKKIWVTAVGETVISQARSVVREVSQLKQLALQARDPFAGQFRLGIFPSLAPYLLQHILPVIKKQLPKLEFFLYDEKTTAIIHQLEKGLLDAVIVALPIAHEAFVIQELFHEPFLVALPKQHKLTRKTNLQLNDLTKETLLLLGEGHCFGDQALEVCQLAGASSHATYHATSLEILRYMVAANSGITLLPFLAVNPKDKTIAIRSLTPRAPVRQIGMVWRKQSARTIVCEALTKIIQQTMFKIIPQVKASKRLEV